MCYGAPKKVVLLDKFVYDDKVVMPVRRMDAAEAVEALQRAEVISHVNDPAVAKLLSEAVGKAVPGEGEYRPGDGGVAVVAISKAPRPKSLGVLAGILRPLLIVKRLSLPLSRLFLLAGGALVDVELWSKTPSNNARPRGQQDGQAGKRGEELGEPPRRPEKRYIIAVRLEATLGTPHLAVG